VSDNEIHELHIGPDDEDPVQLLADWLRNLMEGDTK
jgi:hypothetical protein